MAEEAKMEIEQEPQVNIVIEEVPIGEQIDIAIQEIEQPLQVENNQDVVQQVNPPVLEQLQPVIADIIKEKIGSILTKTSETAAQAATVGKQYALNALDRGTKAGKEYAMEALSKGANVGKEYGKQFLNYLFNKIKEGNQEAKKRLYNYFNNLKISLIKKLTITPNYINILAQQKLSDKDYKDMVDSLKDQLENTSYVLINIKTKEYFLWNLFYGMTMTPDNVIYLSISGENDSVLTDIGKNYQELENDVDPELKNIVNRKNRSNFIENVNELFKEYYSLLRKDEIPQVTTKMRILFFIELNCPENGGDPSYYETDEDYSSVRTYADYLNFIDNKRCKFDKDISEGDHKLFQQFYEDDSKLRQISNEIERNTLKQKMDKYMQEAGIEYSKSVPGIQRQNEEIQSMINYRLGEIGKIYNKYQKKIEEEYKRKKPDQTKLQLYNDKINEIKKLNKVFVSTVENYNSKLSEIMKLSPQQINKSREFYKQQTANLKNVYDQADSLVDEMQKYKETVGQQEVVAQAVKTGIPLKRKAEEKVLAPPKKVAASKKVIDESDQENDEKEQFEEAPTKKSRKGGKRNKTAYKGGKKRTIKKGGKKRVKKTIKRSKRFTKRSRR